MSLCLILMASCAILRTRYKPNPSLFPYSQIIIAPLGYTLILVFLVIYRFQLAHTELQKDSGRTSFPEQGQKQKMQSWLG